MGKNKKITEKVRLFYRGSIVAPTKIATNDDMKTLVQSFKSCLPKRNNVFITNWGGQKQKFKLRLLVGLSSGLRALKHKRTKAIIYDDTAGTHLAKYLIEFAKKQGLPIIQAHRLIDIAPDLGFKTLLVISVVSVEDNDPSVTIESLEFNQLCKFLSESTGGQGFDERTVNFKLPVLDKVPSSGISKEKKQARQAQAASKQTHVGKIKKLKTEKCKKLKSKSRSSA